MAPAIPKYLLKQLDKKDIPFLSTNTISVNKPVHLGLVRPINVGVKDGKGGKAKYWSHCDERYFPDNSSKNAYFSSNGGLKKKS